MTLKLHIGDLWMTSCGSELYLVTAFNDTFDAGYQRWVDVIVIQLSVPSWSLATDVSGPYDDMFTEIDIINCIKDDHWKLVSSA